MNDGPETADRTLSQAEKILENLIWKLDYSVGTLSDGIGVDATAPLNECVSYLSETLKRVVLGLMFTGAVIVISSKSSLQTGIVLVVLNVAMTILISDAIIQRKLSQFDAFPSPTIDTFESQCVNIQLSSLQQQLMDLKTEFSSLRLQLTTGDDPVVTLKQVGGLITSTHQMMYPRPLFANLFPAPKFQASSSANYGYNQPQSSLLHKPNDPTDRDHACWHRASGTDGNEYLEVDLGEKFLITEIHTRGRAYRNQYITQYRIGFVDDRNKHVLLTNLDGSTEFDANYDGTSAAINTYFRPFVARIVRIYPIKHKNNVCLNWDLVGVSAQLLDSFSILSSNGNPTPTVPGQRIDKSRLLKADTD
jgi:hypothetical protein